MKYYLKRKGDRYPSEISQERFFSLNRSNKWREKVWINGGEKVGRELIEKE